ncbi:hypothetical protein FHL15_005637 [Xylaria flabelliformis]|uniref:Uncharacterized protein n=1 Tax=Xylaria flabelliformis TaxID=2512241 RepID=A0A553HZI2_9PEZI|nr:hypothetical protein FHL15_005637 [Xylaria flabelliformis]
MFSSPECPIHDQTGHQNRRQTSTTTPLQRPNLPSPETADSYLHPWGASRPARDETKATASGTEWVDRTDFVTARPKPSRTGGADAKALLELQENGMRKRWT